MSTEPLLSSIIPFAGIGLLGYAMGSALKKVLYRTHWVGCVIPLNRAQFRHKTRINGSRGVTAMLRKLSKKRN